MHNCRREHAHNHVIMAYKMYYRFDFLDPTFPMPVSPREIVIPEERPTKINKPSPRAGSVANGMSSATDDEPQVDVAELLGEGKAMVEDRRKVMQEVREHLELLKEFDGVISEEDLAKRKRELFLALPGAPPPMPPLPPLPPLQIESSSAKKLKMSGSLKDEMSQV
jgi:hypothetical protein